jgi:predicted NBD/HSP70 family sugar kinase
LLPKGRVEIVKASLGNDAGVVGAASLVMQAANDI